MLRSKGLLLALATTAGTAACTGELTVNGDADVTASDANGASDVRFDAPIDVRQESGVVGDSGVETDTGVVTDTGIACPMGQTRCDATCVDLQADRINCGACGASCPGTQVCVAGACQLECAAPEVRCGEGAMMTCVNTQADVANCGACGASCAPAGATGACSMGVCTVRACNSGLGDCDSNAMNGCETDTSSSLAHCGACGVGCAPANAVGACTMGSCGVASCSAGFADCNGSAADGCEVNTTSSASHCGACGAVCAAGQSCSAGVCSFGGGASGPLMVTGAVTVNVNAASITAAAGAMAGVLSNVSGTIAAGRVVLIHQTQASTGAVGLYEYARVAVVAGTAITFDRALTNTYTTDATSKAQVVVVDEFTTLAVAAGGALTAPSWNGNTGGILAIDVQGALSLGAGGSISMSGRGFRGTSHACFYRCQTGVQGESSIGVGSATNLRNGAGGGGGTRGQDGSSGGGGGYGAQGTNGSDGSGAGGCGAGTNVQPGGVAGVVAGDADLRGAFFFGGAGGEGGGDEDGAFPGVGGNGGGAIFVRAASAGTFAGSVSSNGNAGGNGDQGSCGGGGCGMGGGGGGAGGTIRLQFNSAVNIGASLVSATGGGAGSPTCGTGPAGVGGVGRVAIVSPATVGASSPAFDPR